MRLALDTPIPSLLHFISSYPASSLSRTPFFNLELASAEAAAQLCAIKEFTLTAPTFTATINISRTASPEAARYGPAIATIYPHSRPMDVISLSCAFRALNQAFFGATAVQQIVASNKCGNPHPSSLLHRGQLLAVDLQLGTAMLMDDAANSLEGQYSCTLIDGTPLHLHHIGPVPGKYTQDMIEQTMTKANDKIRQLAPSLKLPCNQIKTKGKCIIHTHLKHTSRKQPCTIPKRKNFTPSDLLVVCKSQNRLYGKALAITKFKLTSMLCKKSIKLYAYCPEGRF